MKSYLNKPELKESFLEQIRWHQEQDNIVQGTYGQNNKDFKGCAVGCSIRSLNQLNGTRLPTNNHAAYEDHLGIPEWLARLEDTLFEGLPVEQAKEWPLRFSEAIPVGVDLEPLKWQFSVYLMKENIARVRRLDIADNLKTEVLGAIKKVLAVHRKALKTGEWDESARSAAESAESAAWSAARSAWSARSAAWSARSAAWSAAWSAARSAAESAARSAESAARSAARSAESAARSAARSAAYVKHADKLIEMLQEFEGVVQVEPPLEALKGTV